MHSFRLGLGERNFGFGLTPSRAAVWCGGCRAHAPRSMCCTICQSDQFKPDGQLSMMVLLRSRRSGPTRPSATWPLTRPSATQANSWGLAFAAPMVGARLVLPGPFLDGASVYKLLEEQRITHTAGECGCPGFVYGCVGRVVAGC